MKKRPFDALIFDLDDTLFDTWGQLSRPAYHDVCETMIRFGLKIDISQAMSEIEKLVSLPRKVDVIKTLVEKFAPQELQEEIHGAGFEAYYDRPVSENIHPFSDTLPILKELKLKDYLLYLVTYGSPLIQQSKVKRLKIGNSFTKIVYVDYTKKKNKKEGFGQVLLHSKCEPGHFLSVGDRIDREIAIANSFGMKSCRVKRGEHALMVPSTDLEIPDFEIKHISELIKTCQL